MNADSLTFDQRRFERLNAQAVQSGSAVQQNGVLFNDILENVPHHGVLLLHHFFGLLDGGAVALRFELVVDERLKKLERHLLRKAALIELEFRANDDDRAAGIVHALAEQVLAETTLLALERVAQRLERAVVGSAQYAAAAAVVKQCVHGLLQHALFVAHDHVRRAELHQLLQPVVAVDDAAIQVVQVGSGKAAAIKRNERAQLRWKDWNHVQNHPFRLVAPLAERFEPFQALGELDPLLQRRIGFHLVAKLIGEPVHIDAAEKFFNAFRAHASGELAGVFLRQLAVFLFGQNLAFSQDGDLAGIHDDERFEVQNALEVAHGNVQQVADAAGQALEEPHVRTGRSQLDVAKAFAANLRQGDFDAALVADDAAVLHPLVLAAQTFPVRNRTENLCAEQTVTLGLEGAVVNGLRLGDFAVRPG